MMILAQNIMILAQTRQNCESFTHTIILY